MVPTVSTAGRSIRWRVLEVTGPLASADGGLLMVRIGFFKGFNKGNYKASRRVL